jgi:hypothetical protein
MLLFVQVSDSQTFTFIIIFVVRLTSDFFIVDAEGDVVGGPRDLISVPIIGRIKVIDIVRLVGEAGPNQICRDFIMIMRLYLYIYVVPVFKGHFLILIAEEQGQERRQGTFPVRPLNLSLELSVQKGFFRGNLTTDVGPGLI